MDASQKQVDTANIAGERMNPTPEKGAQAAA
jgi:hypothetical protein